MKIDSEIYYNQLQKKYSRKITLGLSRIKRALTLLGNPQHRLKNPINIIGSDGKFSCLTSLKYFIEANSKQEAKRFVMEEGCGFDNIEIDHTEKFVEVLKENV